MSIRANIMLLAVPLFLLLAMVNGALLYFQERSDMAHGLREQALAAAVTSAEFIAAMERPRAQLAAPLRARAIAAAAGHIDGLDGLYLVAAGLPPHALVPASHPWLLDGLARPAIAHAFPENADDGGHRYVVAIAPTARGGFVAARIDAEPMYVRMAAIHRAIFLSVLLAGVVAAALAWFAGRRIVRELDKNRQAIAAIIAGEPPRQGAEPAIREARELAGAVRLMEASRAAAAQRAQLVAARRDRERTVETAIAARRDALFAPVSARVAGAAVALRISGRAPLGSFYAVCGTDERAAVAVGRCSAPTPGAELAAAAAARRYLEANLLTMPAADCIAEARAAHGANDIRVIEWQAGETPAGTRLLALADAPTASRAERYAEQNRDAAPAALLDGIGVLIAPDGVLAALGLG